MSNLLICVNLLALLIVTAVDPFGMVTKVTYSATGPKPEMDISKEVNKHFEK